MTRVSSVMFGAGVRVRVRFIQNKLYSPWVGVGVWVRVRVTWEEDVSLSAALSVVVGELDADRRVSVIRRANLYVSMLHIDISCKAKGLQQHQSMYLRSSTASVHGSNLRLIADKNDRCLLIT